MTIAEQLECLTAATMLRRSAAEAYPYRPGIEKLRVEIIAEAHRVLLGRLVTLRQCLEHRSSWQSAMEHHVAVDELLEIDRKNEMTVRGRPICSES